MKDIDFEQELYKHFGLVKDFTLGMRIGQYFYELGCRRTAEKFDEIEYNRQREEESVPNDLEEAAMNYIAPIENEDGLKVINFFGQDIKDAFIAGAKWQEEQDEKEQADLFTIVALDAAERAKEQQYQKDRAEFAKLKAKEWSDGYDEGVAKGKDDMKEQMLNKAEECELYWDGDFLAIDLNMAALGYSERDKVRVIILPKDNDETEIQK